MRVHRIPKFDAERLFNKILQQLQDEGMEIINVFPLAPAENPHYGFLVKPLTKDTKSDTIKEYERVQQLAEKVQEGKLSWDRFYEESGLPRPDHSVLNVPKVT